MFEMRLQQTTNQTMNMTEFFDLLLHLFNPLHSKQKFSILLNTAIFGKAMKRGECSAIS